MDSALIAWEFVRKVLSPMPGTVEGRTHNTPSFHIKKKFLLRLREDYETLAVYHENRDQWIAKNPEIFFITEHYLKYPYLLIKMADVDPADLEKLLLESWHYRAPKKLVAEYESNR
jgi:hypothetical protein